VSKICWAPLMEAGLKTLRLEPRVFWDLTPAELIFLCSQSAAAHVGLSRSGLDMLIEQYPDSTAKSPHPKRKIHG